MAVDTLKDSIEIDLLSSKGWIGTKASGSFGQVEGWIQYEPGSVISNDYINTPAAAEAIICAKDRDEKLIFF